MSLLNSEIREMSSLDDQSRLIDLDTSTQNTSVRTLEEDPVARWASSSSDILSATSASDQMLASCGHDDLNVLLRTAATGSSTKISGRSPESPDKLCETVVSLLDSPYQGSTLAEAHLSSHLQRHLLETTCAQGFELGDSGKKASSFMGSLTSLTDLSMVPPKNIVLFPDMRPLQDVKVNHSDEHQVAKTLLSYSTSSHFGETPKTQQPSGIDDVNLMADMETAEEERQINLQLVSPTTTFDCPSFMPPKIKTPYDDMNIRYVHTPAVSDLRLSPSDSCRFSLVENPDPVRLMPADDAGTPAARTPPQSVRLVPHCATSESSSHLVSCEQPPSFSATVRLMPAKLQAARSESRLKPTTDSSSWQLKRGGSHLVFAGQSRSISQTKGAASSALQLQSAGDLAEKAAPKKRDLQQRSCNRIESKIESISCFKCTTCGFLGASLVSVESHMILEHDSDLAAWDDDVDDGSDVDWVRTARREEISLECPLCPNKFRAEGSRSFKVHLTDDHGETEEEADAQFKRCHQKRRDATLAFLKRKRAKEREKRKRSKQDVLEAYLDASGELRVRNVRGSSGPAASAESDSNVDVSAGEYVEAISMAKKIDKKTTEAFEVRPSEEQQLLIQMSTKASSRTAAAATALGNCVDAMTPSLLLHDDKNYINGGVSDKVRTRLKRFHAGRPRGSRSLGITKLRRLNPNIYLSEDRIGSECGVDGCAVRLVDEKKLEYHRQSHAESGGGGGFVCLVCQSKFDRWQTLAIHLWRCHRLDMELYSCQSCDTFRSYTVARMESHRLTHRSERCFLCEDCGKGFKTDKNLKTHKTLHSVRKVDDEPLAAQGSCGECRRTFREVRLLKLHMDTVHNKLKPHLCNFCGYSASSKSSLKLHLRLHTGEKPYNCDDCDYRTADHNSLRRHRMRHSGEKPYKCPHCAYSSIQSSTYKIHLKNKHPSQADQLVFNCQHCLFKTVKEGNYLTHLAEHRTRKDEKLIEVSEKQEVKAELPSRINDSKLV